MSLTQTREVVREVNAAGRVGFDSFPYQLVQKMVANGFDFNILCVGGTGVGKSTLCNSLFNTTFNSRPETHKETRVKITEEKYELQENDIVLHLTMVHTVGYGDQINRDESFQDAVDYINKQFESYLDEELKIVRKLHCYRDTRIHACLFFITPNGVGLKPFDISCLKKIHQKVNVIPVIAKADSVTKEELVHLKKKILETLEDNDIKIYQPKVEDIEEDKKMVSGIPYAIVASNEISAIGDEFIRVRSYPWGNVEIDNPDHSDFSSLRELLIRSSTEDLIEQTHKIHYEMYRRERLKDMGFESDSSPNNVKPNYTDTLLWKKSKHLQSFAQREEELRKKFHDKVQVEDSALLEKEKKLEEDYENFKIVNAREKISIEKRRKALDVDITQFLELKAQYEMSQRSPTHTGSYSFHGFSRSNLRKTKKNLSLSSLRPGN